MLDAYSFGSALELGDFCARHHIQADDTYAVLQSMAPFTFDEETTMTVMLTLVLDMPHGDLERTRERERAHGQAQRERVREEAVRKQAEARDAETRQRWMEENSVDIPF